jgi:NADH dehydrogenase
MSEQAEVLVLGGGYAGLTFARTLVELVPDLDVALVDREPVHQLVIQLHEAAAFSTPLERLAVPFEQVRARARVLQRTVTGFDLPRRQVLTDHGPLTYRWLVIALGSEVSDAGIPGVRLAFPLRWLDDARRLRDHLATLAPGLAAAAPADRSAWQTIVIGGGGATGVQLAGELADWLRDDWNRPAGGRIVLIEATPSLLPRFPPELGREAARILRAKGVSLYLDEPVTAFEDGVVCLASGERIPTRTFIWAGGIRLPQVITSADLPLRNRAVVTDEFLRLPLHPEVFVLGDCVAVADPRSGDRLPASAQLATQMGRAAAENIARAIAGRPLRPFRPTYLGEAVSVGRDNAVVRVGPLVLRGLPGLAVKTFTEQRYIESIGGMALLREWSARSSPRSASGSGG